MVTRKKVGASPRISRPRDLPERAVTNAELTTRFAALGNPTVVGKLAASTGVTRRFYVPDDWVTSGLALPAAKEALKRAGRKPENVDLIIVLRFRECCKRIFPSGARGIWLSLNVGIIIRLIDLWAAARVTTSINTVCVRARKIRTTKYRDRAKVLGRQ